MLEQKPTPTTHIGEFLQDYLEDYELSQNALALALHVPSSTINKIIKNKLRLNTELDLRLCKFFNKSPGFFLRAQVELERIAVASELKAELDSIIPYTESKFAKDTKHKHL